MTEHKVGTREEWLAARLKLLEAEKAHTRRGDELAKMRQELPWVRIDKGYRFDTEGGEASLADLFRGRSQLLVYHFMFDPDWDEGCPSCSGLADGFDETHLHLQNHDVAFSRGFPRAAREAAGLPGPHGLELPVGLVGTERLQLRLPCHDRRLGGAGGIQLPGPSRARSGRRRLARVVR